MGNFVEMRGQFQTLIVCFIQLCSALTRKRDFNVSPFLSPHKKRSLFTTPSSNLTHTHLHSFMILSSSRHHNLIGILIPGGNRSSLFIWASLLLLLVFTQILTFCSSFSDSIDNRKTMKIHPMPRKRNITIQYGVNSRNLSEEAQALIGGGGGGGGKKLRRLPHIFSRVLELPFRSDADVSIEENPDCFRFVAETDCVGNDVRAHMVEIYPGVMKIVVRASGSLELSLGELELDIWRFRLPESTRPELASAECIDGELVVTVPKGEEVENDEDGDGGGDGDLWDDGNGDFRGIGNRLVLVQ